MLRALLVLLALQAPFQCASDPEDAAQLEDSAPGALWSLAERLDAEGEQRALELTLQTLIEQYPSSREAERARLALEGGGVSESSASSESGASEDGASSESGASEDGAP